MKLQSKFTLLTVLYTLLFVVYPYFHIHQDRVAGQTEVEVCAHPLPPLQEAESGFCHHNNQQFHFRGDILHLSPSGQSDLTSLLLPFFLIPSKTENYSQSKKPSPFIACVEQISEGEEVYLGLVNRAPPAFA